jgi:hypothetical protein
MKNRMTTSASDHSTMESGLSRRRETCADIRASPF